MIQSAKEAREIISQHEQGKCEECFEGECMDEAVGYLACLKGPEVRALVEALEKALKEKTDKNSYPAMDCICTKCGSESISYCEVTHLIEDALSRYREAIKP